MVILYWKIRPRPSFCANYFLFLLLLPLISTSAHYPYWQLWISLTKEQFLIWTFELTTCQKQNLVITPGYKRPLCAGAGKPGWVQWINVFDCLLRRFPSEITDHSWYTLEQQLLLMGAAPGPQEKVDLKPFVPGHNQHKCASLGEKSGKLRSQSMCYQ